MRVWRRRWRAADTDARPEPVAHAEHAGHIPAVAGHVDGGGVEDTHDQGSFRVATCIQDPGQHHDDRHGDGDHDNHRHRDDPASHPQPDRPSRLTQPTDEH